MQLPLLLARRMVMTLASLKKKLRNFAVPNGGIMHLLTLNENKTDTRAGRNPIKQGN